MAAVAKALTPGRQDARTPAVRGSTPTDRIFLLYLAANSAIVLWHARDIPGWALLLVANALSVLLVVLLSRAPLTPTVRFLSGGYAILLTSGYYAQLGLINTGVAHVHDLMVQRWDRLVFGQEIAMTWHYAMPNLLLSSVLHICYASYYWLVPFAAIWLFARHRREAYERAGFIITLSFYLCYLLFALVPVAGPRYFFGAATGPAAQVLPARFVHAVLEGGSAWGTAFPSSHVAVAWCAVYALWRDARVTALLLAPIALGVPFGTVYGQFHYGVDALAGMALAVLLCLVADRLRNAWRPATPPSP